MGLSIAAGHANNPVGIRLEFLSNYMASVPFSVRICMCKNVSVAHLRSAMWLSSMFL